MNLDIHYDSRAPSTLTGPGAVHRLDPPLVAPGDGSERPQCFLCGKVLANASMKPAKLKEHLISMHPKNALDSVESFRS